MQYAQKFLASHVELWAVVQAAGLLAYPPETQTEPYRVCRSDKSRKLYRFATNGLQGLYSESRWNDLARLFIRTHHELFSIPAQPLLHIALSAGLSALKTPSCHSKNASSSANASSSTISVCPICSTELNELARNMPYAHHPKSYVENDPVVLPNGRVYGHERLKQTSLKYGLDPAKEVKDPTTSQIFDQSEIRKVYIL